MSNATLKRQTQSGADFSECGRYRYKLWRTWDDIRPVVMFIMLNPSTADATADDPTIRRCIGFARAWGYGGVRVGNLFAWRTPYPQRVAFCSRTDRTRQRQRPVRTGRGRRAGGCGVGRTWDVACASAGPSANSSPVLSTRSVSRSPVSRPTRSVCGARARPFCWIGEGGLFESLLRFVVLPAPHFPLA